MERNTILLILTVALVLGLVVISAIRRYFLAEQHLRLRKMIHDERMKAMQQGLEIPQADVADHVALSPAPLDVRTLRLVVLCAGLFLVCGGLGICVGFAFAADERTSQAWSLGFVPGLAGFGLLLFYRLSAAVTESPGALPETPANGRELG